MEDALREPETPETPQGVAAAMPAAASEANTPQAQEAEPQPPAVAAVVVTFPNGLPPVVARDLREFLRERHVRAEGL